MKPQSNNYPLSLPRLPQIDNDMKRKAFLVGIEDYQSDYFPALDGVIDETKRLKELLSWHEECGRNFHCELMHTEGGDIDKGKLRQELITFFNQEGVGEGLLYFSGHGAVIGDIGYLCTSDATPLDPGISFFELQALAINSKINELVIIIDCCFSGEFFQLISQGENQTNLRKGLAILSGTGAKETAEMRNGKSLFTQAIHHGLDGQAADLVGNVTVGNLYRNTDQLLSMADQRPQFAAFLNQEIVLRKCKPTIDHAITRKLDELFREDEKIDLSPAYEPSAPPHDPIKEADFAVLQKLAKVGFVVPIGENHMYYAAMNHKKCGLTSLGKYYRQLVLKEVI